MSAKTIDIIFDGPPSAENGRFVEVEREGKSVAIGEWFHRPDGLWALRLPDPERLQAAIDVVLRDAPTEEPEDLADSDNNGDVQKSAIARFHWWLGISMRVVLGR